MNPTACSSAAADSGLAPAPELWPYGAPAAATSPCRAFMNKPQPFFLNSYLDFLFAELDAHNTSYN